MRAFEDDKISLEGADGLTGKVTRASFGQVTPRTQSVDEEAELTGHPVDEPEEK